MESFHCFEQITIAYKSGKKRQYMIDVSTKEGILKRMEIINQEKKNSSIQSIYYKSNIDLI